MHVTIKDKIEILVDSTGGVGVKLIDLGGTCQVFLEPSEALEIAEFLQRPSVKNALLNAQRRQTDQSPPAS
jgi:hypothetical protein